MTGKLCSYDGCERPSRSKGMCQTHYMRIYRNGTTDRIYLETPELRFWSKVQKTETCWNWVGSIHPKGYGNFRDGKAIKAHRFAYQLLVGPIPDGMQIDHVCRNRSCVNPEHLRPVTNKQNQENRSGAANSTSGIRGVTWDKQVGKWLVSVVHNRRNHNGGRYDNLKDAERAVIALRNRLFTHNDVDRDNTAA